MDCYLRKQVTYDDIIDAMAVAITALSDKLMSLFPQTDSRGLPMQMVYAAFK